MTAAGEMTVPNVVWWRRWIVRPVMNQLTAGISPDRLGWSISTGVVLGIFPIMGTTSLLCLLFGWCFKLNQPVLHVFKSLVYPLQLGLILVFIRMGQKLYGVPLLALSIPQMLTRFRADPMQFARDFGLAAWHGITAWMIVAPLLAILIKLLATPLLRKAARKIQSRREARA
jgi:uncharacterized protein (DUF2062 family)